MTESRIKKIRKREGYIIDFDQSRITNAILRALDAVREEDGKSAQVLSDKVVEILNQRFEGKIPKVEEIQDIVIQVLKNEGYEDVANSYTEYRKKRQEIRDAKWWLLNHAVKTKLTSNALQVLESRYLRKDENGKIIETPQQLFQRVSRNIASAEKIYNPGIHDDELFRVEEKFFRMMASLNFLPNTPTLMNAGNVLQQLSACFVLDIPDSMEGIFEAVKNTALIFQSGGGTGYSFSELRPEGDIVKSTSGIASGPLSFMNVFNAATETVKQGGRRRGAMMGILRIDHPDILKFITAKAEEGILSNFNLSVALTDEFIEKVKKGEKYNLINPRSNQVWGELDAKEVFNLIVHYAWLNGEPGVIFIDTINKYNPTPQLGKIQSTNPCVIGDTLVAVADGRNYVPIKQLAEEKKDIPVYCYGNGRTQIRMGRNARKTREEAPVWKVTLDDGSYIIATEDHKLRGRDNTEIELKNLKPGASLMPFYKFQYSATGKRTMYWGVSQNNSQRARAEHRMVVEFYTGRKIKKYPREVVHHKNSNGLDNWIENLETLSQEKHDSFHQVGEKNVMKGKWWQKLSEKEKNIYKAKMSKMVRGENNGMFGKRHSKQTKEIISKLRKEYYNSHPEAKEVLRDRIRWIYQNTDLAKRISLARTKYGYIEVSCLNCGAQFIKKENRFKQFCSKSCRATFINRTRDTSTVKETKKKRREVLRKNLYNLGLKFFGRRNRLPNYDEFRKLAKRYNYSGDVRSTFGGYKNFKEQLILSNHKVVSVEFYGYEDVYNITVDDFHTIAYVTNTKAETKITKKSLISGIITSQCGEVPLLPFESCNLASINLVKILKKKDEEWQVDWNQLKQVVYDGVHFLDNVVDVNRYPIPEIEAMTKGNRKIGLGVMGWADMLVRLEIPYDSKKALHLAEKIMKFIQGGSHKASAALAEKRGAFPNFKNSVYDDSKITRVRNATTTTVAPTGTISIIAGCSFGIEPYYAISFVRKYVLGGQELVEVNPIFEEIAKKEGFYSKELMGKIAEKGSIQEIKEIPEKWRKIFVTAHDIAPEWHVKMQAVFQKYTDNAVSKTINFPFSATEEDIRNGYLLAYEMGCKGITLYRSESRKQQVLNIQGTGQEALPVEANSREKIDGKVPEQEISPELKNPSPEIPDLPPGGCPTCTV